MTTSAITGDDIDGFVSLATGNRSELDMLYTMSMVILHIRTNISGMGSVRLIASEDGMTKVFRGVRIERIRKLTCRGD